MIPIKEVTYLFDGDSAEHDRNLTRYFVKTLEYQSIKDGEVMLVLGRKGSGKSSIYKYYRDTENGSQRRVVGLSFANYPWAVHNSIRDEVKSAQNSHEHTWQFLILVTLAGLVLEPHGWWARILKPGISILNRFLKKTFGSIAPNPGEVLVDAAGRIRELEVKVLGTGGKITLDNGRLSLSNSITFANSRLIEIIREHLDTKKKYHVLFDELDRGWENTDEFKASLVGLVQAVSAINSQFSNSVRCIVFLRTDIFRTLRFEDRNKYNAPALKVELSWDEERLKQLIEERIHRLCETPTREGSWDFVFTKPNMQKAPKARYMLRRTYLRPRDIIMFCAQSRLQAVTRDSNMIDNPDIYAGEASYSERIYDELIDENRQHYPFLEDLLGVLKDIGKETVSKEEFEVQTARRKSLPSFEECVEVLLSLSVIGVRRIGGNAGGERFVFRYQDNNLKLDGPEFVVHRSLKKHLQLRAVRRGVTLGEEDEEEEEPLSDAG